MLNSVSLLLKFNFIDILCSGGIEIDGVDISKIGLGTLRSRLTIIPQVTIGFRIKNLLFDEA